MGTLQLCGPSTNRRHLFLLREGVFRKTKARGAKLLSKTSQRLGMQIVWGSQPAIYSVFDWSPRFTATLLHFVEYSSLVLVFGLKARLLYERTWSIA